MTPNYDTLIVVPCYNEANRLPSNAFQQFANTHPQYHFLFVNDGSTDHTLSHLQTLAQSNPDQLALLTLPKNKGKAIAVQQGFQNAQAKPYQYIGFWDADLATPLDQLPLLREKFDERKQLKMVFGSRVNLLGRKIHRTFFRHYLGRIFATAASITLGLPIYDTQCGAKLFKADLTLQKIFKDPFISKWCFDVEILARYLTIIRNPNKNLGPIDPTDHIFEFPLHAWQDVKGSKMRWYDFFKGPYQLFKISRTYKKIKIRSGYRDPQK